MYIFWHFNIPIENRPVNLHHGPVNMSIRVPALPLVPISRKRPLAPRHYRQARAPL